LALIAGKHKYTSARFNDLLKTELLLINEKQNIWLANRSLAKKKWLVAHFSRWPTSVDATLLIVHI